MKFFGSSSKTASPTSSKKRTSTKSKNTPAIEEDKPAAYWAAVRESQDFTSSEFLKGYAARKEQEAMDASVERF